MSGEVFTAEIKVRFADVDHAGIVYYPRFFHYFHIAFEELFEQTLGRPYAQVFGDGGFGFPAVHAEADYRAPVRFGDVLRIGVTCLRIGTRSFTLRYRAVRAADGVECAEGRVTCVCVDMNDFRPMDILEPYRALFTRHLEG